MIAEFGDRIPVEVKDRFRSVLNDSILIPSLSHYLRYASHCLPYGLLLLIYKQLPGCLESRRLYYILR